MPFKMILVKPMGDGCVLVFGILRGTDHMWVGVTGIAVSAYETCRGNREQNNEQREIFVSCESHRNIHVGLLAW
jgi:hypothetical protein